jgi:pyrroloquinoline quinone biosynthesis protein E
LLLELTYRCPLQCVFCYNPVDFANTRDELTTDDWLRVLREARELGAVQLGLSGGEPLLRDDVEIIVAEAHRLGYYINLITSGVGLTEARVQALKSAGLDHIQLSFQDSTRESNDYLSHTKTFDLKRRVSTWIKEAGFSMVVNCVIHRLNIDRVGDIIALADDIDADYLELANAQYYSWAFLNRDQLLPSRSQIDAARRMTEEWRNRVGKRMRILFVTPDYYESRPKRCMNGWATTFMTVTPDGTALPCHTAKMLPGMSFPNVRTANVDDIWHRSDAFNRFRGTSWMKEPCASCDERDTDLGGCRCQAFLLANDPTVADPVCAKSPHRDVVTNAVAAAQRVTAIEKPLIFRSHRSKVSQVS